MLKHRSVFAAVALAAAVVLVTGHAAMSSGSSSAGTSGSAAMLAGTAGCGKTPTLTSGTRNITTSGKNRTYILRIPAN
ncbi:hypothetical protein, partial [Sphaerisporangium aureirubrum]